MTLIHDPYAPIWCLRHHGLHLHLQPWPPFVRRLDADPEIVCGLRFRKRFAGGLLKAIREGEGR